MDFPPAARWLWMISAWYDGCLMSFPIFFKHAPIGHRYQIAVIMHDENGPGAVMEFQNEVFDYRPEDSEVQAPLFHYQPPVLVSINSALMPSLAEMRHDPNWEEAKIIWNQTNVTGVGDSSDE